MLLIAAGQEAGHVNEGDKRDVEGVAEADEARRLGGGVDVEASRQVARLVRHHPHRATVEPRKADDYVERPVGVDFEEIPIVEDLREHLVHIVGLVGVVGQQRIEFFQRPLGVVGGFAARRIFDVILRHEAQQHAELVEGVLLALTRQMRHSRFAVMRHRPAQFLKANLFVGDRPNHVGAGDEHVAGLLDHQDEIGDGRAVNRAARARPHDDGELRYHPGGLDVAVEYLGVAAEAYHPFLDACAARILEADNGHAVLERQVHHLADFLGVHLAQRPA